MKLLARIKQKDEDLCQFKAALTFVKLLSLLPLVCEILKLNTEAGRGEMTNFLMEFIHGHECARFYTK